jgi:hypothetical protein
MAYLKKEPKRNKWISLRFNLRFKKNPASVGSGRVYSKISKHVVYTGFAKDLRIIIKSFFWKNILSKKNHHFFFVIILYRFVLQTNIKVIKNCLLFLLKLIKWVNLKISWFNFLPSLDLKLNCVRVILTWYWLKKIT